MKLYLVLYLLTREVAAVIQSVAWKEVLVSQTLVSFTVTLPVSAVKAGNICDATDKCVLVCAVEGGYGLSEKEVEPDYYEKAVDEMYKCWTKMTMKYTPLKLEQDGLFYHADFTRSPKLNGEHCILACRRIPGYRSAIIRTDDQFSAIYEEYVEPYNLNDKSHYLFTGLVKHQNGGEVIYKWADGTAFDLTFNVVADYGHHMYHVLHGTTLNDYNEIVNCLCQGNPSLLDW